MALAEAIAHGLPVVSTMAGAIPDTVPAGTGLLVPILLRKSVARWARSFASVGAAPFCRPLQPEWRL
jgi:glycosyltransferase involved in cell wall biosynthesis